MSTVKNGDVYDLAGHSDVEQMEIAQHFNSTSHNISDSSKNSTLEASRPSPPDAKDEERGRHTRPSKTEDMEEIVISPGTAELPPDGGLKAWLQVLAGHLMNFNTWGYINSYGIFEAYYIGNLRLGASTVSWTASIQIFLLCFIGVFSGRALDAGYFRPVVALGCFFQLLAIFMTSLCDQYWQLFLAQGVCQGIGNGLVFTPTVGLVSTYFSKKRNFAVNLVLSGSVSGGFAFPLMAQHLLPSLGYAWSVRIMGFVMLFNVAVILALLRTRIEPRPSGPLLELSAFKEPPYMLFAMAAFLVLWPVYYAYDYINIFATNIIHVSPSTSLTILLIFNVVGFPGRIVPALLADYYFGPLNVLLFLSSGCFILIYVWISISSYGGLVAFSILYGIFNGGVQGLFMTALTSLTTDLSKMGTRLGMVLTILAFCTLTGAPIAGALIDAEGGRFLAVQLFGGTSMLLGMLILAAARVAKSGWILMRKI